MAGKISDDSSRREVLPRDRETKVVRELERRLMMVSGEGLAER